VALTITRRIRPCRSDRSGIEVDVMPMHGQRLTGAGVPASEIGQVVLSRDLVGVELGLRSRDSSIGGDSEAFLRLMSCTGAGSNLGAPATSNAPT
jgi:hypothetical protein